MNYWDYYKILRDFIDLNKNHWGYINIGYSDRQSNSYNYEPYLAFYTKRWEMWQNLLKNYSHKQLSDYLVEVIRKELPQLKDVRIYIYDSTGINPMILDLPKEETDKFLYII